MKAQTRIRHDSTVSKANLIHKITEKYWREMGRGLSKVKALPKRECQMIVESF